MLRGTLKRSISRATTFDPSLIVHDWIARAEPFTVEWALPMAVAATGRASQFERRANKLLALEV